MIHLTESQKQKLNELFWEICEGKSRLEIYRLDEVMDQEINSFINELEEE